MLIVFGGRVSLGCPSVGHLHFPITVSSQADRQQLLESCGLKKASYATLFLSIALFLACPLPLLG
jgi:hypothetical protein